MENVYVLKSKISVNAILRNISLYIKHNNAHIIQDIFKITEGDFEYEGDENNGFPLHYKCHISYLMAKTKKGTRMGAISIIIYLKMLNFLHTKKNTSDQLHMLMYQFKLYPKRNLRNIPNLKDTKQHIQEIAQGLHIPIKKTWSKKKILQNIYPNLHFI